MYLYILDFSKMLICGFFQRFVYKCSKIWCQIVCMLTIAAGRNPNQEQIQYKQINDALSLSEIRTPESLHLKKKFFMQVPMLFSHMWSSELQLVQCVVSIQVSETRIHSLDIFFAYPSMLWYSQRVIFRLFHRFLACNWLEFIEESAVLKSCYYVNA